MDHYYNHRMYKCYRSTLLMHTTLYLKQNRYNCPLHVYNKIYLVVIPICLVYSLCMCSNLHNVSDTVAVYT